MKAPGLTASWRSPSPRTPRICGRLPEAPSKQTGAAAVNDIDIDRLMKETLFAALSTGHDKVEYGGVLCNGGGKAWITFEIRREGNAGERGDWCGSSGFLDRNGRCRNPDGCTCDVIIGLRT